MAASAAPDWPRMMRLGTAAAYCDMPSAAFEREVAGGRLPDSVMLGGQKRWSRAQLDGALERLTGDDVPDWRVRQPLYAEGEG
jgi:hypothetical protein